LDDPKNLRSNFENYLNGFSYNVQDIITKFKFRNELETLDEIHKTVFLLHYREGFPLKDIAQTLDISEGTVKSRLHYTRKRLAERLAKYHPNISN
jgi:RNA polymerase sigma factor (sigma-70 family)